MPDYELREYREGDEQSLLETFNYVFGQKDPNYVPRTLEEWRWAFLENPAGWRIWVAVCEGRVVAQFAGQPFRMLIRGEEQTFVHCVDSMSHPDHRRGLKRPGLFVNVANEYFDHYGGIEKDWAHYGLPIEEAARMGDRFLKYEIIKTQVFLAKELGPGPTELPEGVERLERFDHQVRWLYERCCGPWGVSAIRDDALYNWRFANHPRHRYLSFGVRDVEGVLRGVAVYRHASWVFDNVGFVVEWLVPPEEPEVGRLLNEAVQAQARADGAQASATSIPEWSPWFGIFQEWGWLVHPSDYCLRVRKFHPKYPAELLRDIWWHQLSETDLL